MRNSLILLLGISFCFLSCGGGENKVNSQKNSEDSAAIMQEILESEKILKDRVEDEKATEYSLVENRIIRAGEFLNGGWFCILNTEDENNTRTFDLYLFDFDINSEITIHKMTIADNGVLDDYIQHQKSYGVPFRIKDEITATKAVMNSHKTTYMMRRDEEGDKFLLTFLDDNCQSVSFFSKYNGEVILSRLPNVVTKSGEVLEVFPTDVSMSEKSAASSFCSNMGFGWRLPDAEEFDGIYKQIFRNNTYSFKSFFYWTSSESKQPRFDIAFDTRLGRIKGHNNTAYVRPVRKKMVFILK